MPRYSGRYSGLDMPQYGYTRHKRGICNIAQVGKHWLCRHGHSQKYPAVLGQD